MKQFGKDRCLFWNCEPELLLDQILTETIPGSESLKERRSTEGINFKVKSFNHFILLMSSLLKL